MKAYDILFSELDRCEYRSSYNGVLEDFTYNGITYAQSECYYHKYLNRLYNEFKSEWRGLSDDIKKFAYKKIKRIIDGRYMSDEFIFDVPSIEIIEMMKRDSAVPKKEIRIAFFLYKMSKEQIYYLMEVANFLDITLPLIEIET